MGMGNLDITGLRNMHIVLLLPLAFPPNALAVRCVLRVLPADQSLRFVSRSQSEGESGRVRSRLGARRACIKSAGTCNVSVRREEK